MLNLSQLNKKLFFAIFSCCLAGAFHHGYHMTAFNIPHQALIDWTVKIEANQSEYQHATWSMTSSMFPFGAFIGSIFTNFKFGPRKVLFHISFFALLGQALMNLSKELDSLLILNSGRFNVGVSTGICSTASAFYLWDIAPTENQKTAIVFFQFFVMISVVTSQVIGMFVGRVSWIMAIMFATIPLTFGIICLQFCPESPKHILFRKQDETRAMSRLIWLRNSTKVTEAFENMKQEQNALGLAPEMTVKNIWSKKLLLCFIVTVSEQLCGVSVFIYYSSEVLHNFGMRNDEPEYVTIGIGLCMTLGTIIALVVIDSLGPKTLLLISLALLFFATTALSIVFQLTITSGEAPECWLFVTCVGTVLLYGFAYGLGRWRQHWYNQ
ncbi:facilitated glucose transporter protein 1-like [Zophobas morio]|uniref:facilitated glucose transporter protein 1-like n=1 Tax=Zophobas morio TaxID=2755281 RepID=UPI0030838A2E